MQIVGWKMHLPPLVFIFHLSPFTYFPVEDESMWWKYNLPPWNLLLQRVCEELVEDGRWFLINLLYSLFERIMMIF